MPAGSYGLTIEQGATWSLQYTVSGAITSLTGYTSSLQIRTVDDRLLADLSVGSGISISTATLTATLSSTATAAMPEGQHIYDHFVTSGSTTTRLLAGPVTVVKRVSR